MHILIIGGFGFLGGRIAKYLTGYEHDVFLGSSSPRETPDWLKNGKSIYVARDDIDSIKKSCQGADVIINAAGMSSSDCAINPVGAFSVNCMDVGHLAAVAKERGVRLFLSISTSHVYSSKLEGIFSEESCPKNYHPYASSHLAGENALLSVAKESNMKAVILRLSNAFGSPVFENKNCWNLVVNDLCMQSATTSNLIVKSSGYQYRDFIGINEVCKAIKTLIDEANYFVLNDIYNLGSGRSKTINEIARLIQERSRILFDKNLYIQNLETSSGVVYENLIYKVEKLKERGFMPTEKENLKELDGLIQYCQVHFGKN